MQDMNNVGVLLTRCAKLLCVCFHIHDVHSAKNWGGESRVTIQWILNTSCHIENYWLYGSSVELSL
jgi:hypothetical protein